jgi:hypothetical protein
VHVRDGEVVGAHEHRAAQLEAWVAGGLVDDLRVDPGHPGRGTERLGQRLLGGEPGRERGDRALELARREQPLAHRRPTSQRPAEPGDVDDVDADTDHRHCASLTRR